MSFKLTTQPQMDTTENNKKNCDDLSCKKLKI